MFSRPLTCSPSPSPVQVVRVKCTGCSRKAIYIRGETVSSFVRSPGEILSPLKCVYSRTTCQITERTRRGTDKEGRNRKVRPPFEKETEGKLEGEGGGGGGGSMLEPRSSRLHVLKSRFQDQRAREVQKHDAENRRESLTQRQDAPSAPLSGGFSPRSILFDSRDSTRFLRPCRAWPHAREPACVFEGKERRGERNDGDARSSREEGGSADAPGTVNFTGRGERREGSVTHTWRSKKGERKLGVRARAGDTAQLILGIPGRELSGSF